MAAIRFFTLVVQSIIQNVQVVSNELDEATQERMQQRAEYLSWEMTRLLQEQEPRTQEQSGSAGEAPVSPALQQWQFWTVAGVLLVLLLFGLCWWLRKRSRQPASSSKEASSRKKADKEEQKANPCIAVDVDRKWAKRLGELQEVFTAVDKFIRICQIYQENYRAVTEASRWYKQHPRRSEFL